MAHESDLNQFHLEWRKIVLDKLESLEEGQKELAGNIVLIKTSFAQQAQLEKLQEKVSILEAFKLKFVGGLIAMQFVLSFLGYVIVKLAK